MNVRTILPVALLAAPAFAQGALAAPTNVTAHLQDPSGKAIAHVYVRQENGATSAFSDESGNVQLALDPKAGNRLLLSAPGYQPVALDAGHVPGTLTMAPAQTVNAPAAEPAAAPATPDLLNSRFGLRYGWRGFYVAGANGSVSGNIDNELGLDFQTRMGDWLLGLDAYRNRAAVRVIGLTAAPGTTFNPETVEGTVELGRVLHLGGLELEPYVGGLWRSVTGPNGAAYTNTPLDFSQSRKALGVGAQVGLHLLPRVTFLGDVGVYPVTTSNLEGSTNQLSGLWGGKLKLGLGYELVPGVRAEVAARQDMWRATSYAEDSTVYTLGLTAYPAEVTP